MRLLLDTHILLWWLADDSRLPRRWRPIVADPENEVVFSSVSVAEISIKSSLGKLEAPNGVMDVLQDGGFAALPLTHAHAVLLGALPWHHRDPFDRMLIAQALCEQLTVATADPSFGAYDVTLLPTES